MDETLKILDRWLNLTLERDLFSANEVMNLCLDVRQALAAPVAPVAPEPEPVPA